MPAYWSGPATALLEAEPAQVAAALAHAQARHVRVSEAAQLRAWDATLAVLRATLAAVTARLPAATAWQVLLAYPLLRLGTRPDVVLVTPRGVFVLEMKVGAAAFAQADREQVEDDALDLQDFHAGSRRHPILPVLVATEAARPVTAPPLPLAGAARVMEANAESLAGLLADTYRGLLGGVCT